MCCFWGMWLVGGAGVLEDAALGVWWKVLGEDALMGL
jgi:hypothetical protein